MAEHSPSTKPVPVKIEEADVPAGDAAGTAGVAAAAREVVAAVTAAGKLPSFPSVAEARVESGTQQTEPARIPVAPIRGQAPRGAAFRQDARRSTTCHPEQPDPCGPCFSGRPAPSLTVHVRPW